MLIEISEPAKYRRTSELFARDTLLSATRITIVSHFQRDSKGVFGIIGQPIPENQFATQLACSPVYQSLTDQ
jgi:hypothetical protein